MWNHRNNDSSSSRDGEVGWCSALSRCIDLLPCKSQHRHSMLYTIQSSDYNASMMLLCSSTLSHEERRQHRLSGTIKRQVFRLKIAPTDRQCVRVGLYVWYHCTIHPHVVVVCMMLTHHPLNIDTDIYTHTQHRCNQGHVNPNLQRLIVPSQHIVVVKARRSCSKRILIYENLSCS